MISYKQIYNKPRIFRCLTGISLEEFTKLKKSFSQAWDNFVTNNYIENKKRIRKFGAGRKPVLKTIDDKLVFILTISYNS